MAENKESIRKRNRKRWKFSRKILNYLDYLGYLGYLEYLDSF